MFPWPSALVAGLLVAAYQRILLALHGDEVRFGKIFKPAILGAILSASTAILMSFKGWQPRWTTVLPPYGASLPDA